MFPLIWLKFKRARSRSFVFCFSKFWMSQSLVASMSILLCGVRSISSLKSVYTIVSVFFKFACLSYFSLKSCSLASEESVCNVDVLSDARKFDTFWARKCRCGVVTESGSLSWVAYRCLSTLVIEISCTPPNVKVRFVLSVLKTKG